MSASSSAVAGQGHETVFVRRTLAGWLLVPADRDFHPLLALLWEPGPPVGPPRPCLSFERLRRSLPWADLAEGLRRVRSAAARAGLSLRVTGDWRRQPTLQLWRKPERPAEEVLRPFSGLRADAAKWGISDFHDDHAKALQEALASRRPFDTGWYSVRKEIQSGRIWRERRAGAVQLQVMASMDDWTDLVDTAAWQARGQRIGAGSGYATLRQLGLDEQGAEAWLCEQADHWAEVAEVSELDDGTSVTRDSRHAGNIGFKRLCRQLDALADACERTLRETYDALVEETAERLDALRRSMGASCRNCKHFSAEMPQTRRQPQSPADCAHPRYHALLSANVHFPFEHGCKFWQARYSRTRQS